MPIPNYSVLHGHPTAGVVVSGASAHYQITVPANGVAYTVAVNIQSVDGSEVLYSIVNNFTPPDTAGLATVAQGITPVASQPGGLAFDFLRSMVNGKPLVTRKAMKLLPIAAVGHSFLHDHARTGHADSAAHALQNAVVALLNQAVADPASTVYAFGSAFADGGVTDGIHDIHMNQGNPLNNHGSDNGIWQYGALLLNLPGNGTWTAVFVAFQTQVWATDSNGNPT